MALKTPCHIVHLTDLHAMMFMYRSHRSDTRMKAQLNKYPWTKLLKKGDIHVIHEPQHKNIAHIYKGNRHTYHKVNPQ